ncbi:LysR family transcriptional regulator [Amycolatopsis magusensis]|uniref:LysR family transcriptional regulator n=1 Tax=Amycolatopsis magusensis TaxID=882444 RepID=UPI003C2D4EDA
MLNPVWLRTLGAVVELGSFADAARLLGYSPSAVSQQMSRLERAIDRPLFNRDRRGVVPTAAAIRLAERATPLLDMLANLDQSEDAGGGVTRLRLGLCAGGLRYARPALRRLAASSSPLALSVVAGESTELVDGITSGSLDVAVVSRYELVPRVWPGKVATWPLADEPLAVLVPPGHRVAGEASVTFRGLRDEWWVAGPEAGDEFRHLQRACAAAEFQPRVAACVEDRDTAAELARDGVGVALAPAAAAVPAGLVAVRVAGPAGRRIEVVHAVADNSAATVGFVLCLREHGAHPSTTDSRTGHLGAAG